MQKEEYLQTIYVAYKGNQQLTKDVFPGGVVDLDGAYNIQHAFTALKEQGGEKLAGYKISMTSKGTQKLFDATEPLYGQLTDKRVVLELALADTLEALIELELVFVAQEDLAASDSDETLLRKVKVAPGLEIPDSRYKDWFPKMSKEYVCCDCAVGGWVAYGEPKVATYASLDKIKGTLLHDGKELSNGTSDIVLAHPLNAVHWLLEKLQSHGLIVKKGMFISSGTFVYPEKLTKGSYEGHFENFGSVVLAVK